MKHDDTTQKIIGAAYEVHALLGQGFMEKVYENAMALELRKAGLTVQQQQPVTVRYKGEVVGEYLADLVVEGIVIVELKAVTELEKVHEVQLVNYLRATGLEVGLLINFGKSVTVKRKVFDQD